MIPYSLVFHFLIFLIAKGHLSNQLKITLNRNHSELENEKLRTEMELLKYQINPHFLFNTLNNIYSLALTSSDKTVPESISRLAKLMRVMTYEVNEDLIPLSQEIDYVHNYLELQKLRLTDSDKLTVTLPDFDVSEYQIAPIILLPFIENAFKHGATSDKISISLRMERNNLIMNVRNAINSNGYESSGGIGLKNALKRLDLLYPGSHELMIESNCGQFAVDLQLELPSK